MPRRAAGEPSRPSTLARARRDAQPKPVLPCPQARSRNLGLIQSARAAARIVTPVIAGTLFQRSPPLPYLVNSFCCLLIAPFPLLLRKAERQAEEAAVAAKAKAG